MKISAKRPWIIVSLFAMALSGSLVSCGNKKNYNPTIDVSGLASSLDTFDNSFRDDVLPSEWNGGMGDPFVCRYNGYYYLIPSSDGGSSGKGVRAWKSEDLLTWAPVQTEGLPAGYILSPDYAFTECAYAPEITYFNGTYYLCTSPYGNGHYFFKSDSPEGPFVPYTENIGESIDGDFFIDSDETPYFLHARTSSIRVKKLNDDMTLSAKGINIESASMGGWTEGPYCLERNGNYYLSFTGVHVVSTGYKVGYAYSYQGGTLFDDEKFTRAENILINTDSSWSNLGHSSTVLGPDLDSYYLAYHSVSKGDSRWRRFNLSRLLFDGTHMAVDRPSKTGTLKPSAPTFQTHNPEKELVSDGDFMLSPALSKKDFTAEWNFTGANAKGVYSFLDQQNYHYLLLESSAISFHNVVGGKDSLEKSVALTKTYDLTKRHTLRLAVKNGIGDLYFDNINKAFNFSLTSAEGKLGFLGHEATPGYFAYSNAALGSSDSTYSKQSLFLANSYDETLSKDCSLSLLRNEAKDENTINKDGEYAVTIPDDGMASYKIYANEEGLYSLSLMLDKASLGSTLLIKIDNQEPKELVLPTVNTNASHVNLFLGKYALSEGEHYLSFIAKGGKSVSFLRGEFLPSQDTPASFTSSLAQEETALTLTGAGFSYDGTGLKGADSTRGLCAYQLPGYENATIEADLTLTTLSPLNSAGLLLRAHDEAYSNWDDNNSLQGYYFGLKNGMAFLEKEDYQALTRRLTYVNLTLEAGTSYHLKATAEGPTLSFYLNGELLFSYNDPTATYRGYPGLYNAGADSLFQNLKIA